MYVRVLEKPVRCEIKKERKETIALSTILLQGFGLFNVFDSWIIQCLFIFFFFLVIMTLQGSNIFICTLVNKLKL